jgi:hypothetical protein
MRDLHQFSRAKQIELAKLDADPVSLRERTRRGSRATATSGTGSGSRFRLVHQEELLGHHRWRAVFGEREPEQLAVVGPFDQSPWVTVLIVIGSPWCSRRSPLVRLQENEEKRKREGERFREEEENGGGGG